MISRLLVILLVTIPGFARADEPKWHWIQVVNVADHWKTAEGDAEVQISQNHIVATLLGVGQPVIKIQGALSKAQTTGNRTTSRTQAKVTVLNSDYGSGPMNGSYIHIIYTDSQRRSLGVAEHEIISLTDGLSFIELVRKK
jgi:hypothetical protein